MKRLQLACLFWPALFLLLLLTVPACAQTPCQQDVEVLEQKLSRANSLLYDARLDLRTTNRENVDLRDMVLAKVDEADRAKRRGRRGWLAALVTLLASLTYISTQK